MSDEGRSNIPDPNAPRRYWYETDVYVCVLCGRARRYRERVYEPERSTTRYIDDACPEHFL